MCEPFMVGFPAHKVSPIRRGHQTFQSLAKRRGKGVAKSYAKVVIIVRRSAPVQYSLVDRGCADFRERFFYELA
jgi:hypothetical protein